MTTKRTTAAALHREWMGEPEYQAAYEALDEEFFLSGALIEARNKANLTQEEVATRMGTTQTAIARLEAGRSMPSTRTLKRFAAATGTHLRIRFESAEPEPKKA